MEESDFCVDPTQIEDSASYLIDFLYSEDSSSTELEIARAEAKKMKKSKKKSSSSTSMTASKKKKEKNRELARISRTNRIHRAKSLEMEIFETQQELKRVYEQYNIPKHDRRIIFNAES